MMYRRLSQKGETLAPSVFNLAIDMTESDIGVGTFLVYASLTAIVITLRVTAAFFGGDSSFVPLEASGDSHV